MASRWGGLLAAVTRDVAAARGLARLAAASAGSARSRTAARHAVVRAAHTACLAQLTEARDTTRREITRHYLRESTRLAADIAGLAGVQAPGAAGAPWRDWAPVEPPVGGGGALLRIGTIGSDRPGECGPTVPALLPLLDRTHLTLTGDRAVVDGIIAGLLLRVLGSTRPGDVRITVYDPEHLGGGLAGFAPLGAAGLLGFVGPGGLTGTLDDLVEQIRRINESVLAGEYASLADITAAGRRRPEPWRLLVLLGDAATAAELTAAQRAQLERIVRTGIACGVHVVSRGLPVRPGPAVESVTVAGGRVRCASLAALPVRPDPAPPAGRVAAFCRELAERLVAGPPPVRFADLAPEKLWTHGSAAGLGAPVGAGPDGELVEVALGDDPPHALVGGPSGAGKTNLLYAWLGALTARYSPDELALYLLDFKEGVSFARFAPSPRDPSWLPQVRLVGVNINSDREFGLAMLRHLADELRRRARAAKRYDASKLAELRAEDPGGHWPRIVAVIDEFQVLVTGRDAVAAEAVNLLEDLARRGRSQGIHLVLASQDVSGIEALWGRSALIAQFTLRIALPKARRILAETNAAADVVPRFHAVVNTDSGVPDANRIVRLPDAGDRAGWRVLQDEQWHARPDGLPPPRLFDGDAVPVFPATGYFPDLAAADPDGHTGRPAAVVGETIDVRGRPAVVRLGRVPGRNLAVLGSRTGEACAVLGSAARSLAAQVPTARFSIACLDGDADHAARLLHAALPDAHWYDPDTVDELLAELADGLTGAVPDQPHYVVGYAFDAVAGRLAGKPADGGPTGHERLRAVLARGPEHRVHLLGWWRTVPRLRDDLGGIGARFDAIGAWVALDVHGGELGPLCPQPGGPDWYPRPHRGLFFDRSVHRTPELVIPYELPADAA
ncbi:FtsK/SpoIIIE domain-containing protein [Polymorphospora rubra]|uniref:FtsK/SpoIIIE domain-containing protein n=1 Tax=Polymorphospora rubra TaxID=338584 RepID=UPI0033DFC16E